jgi:hypothetical protein
MIEGQACQGISVESFARRITVYAEQPIGRQGNECVSLPVVITKLDFVVLARMEHHDGSNLSSDQAMFRAVFEQGYSVKFFQIDFHFPLRVDIELVTRRSRI